MNKINDFIEILDIILNIKKSQSLLCSNGLASIIFEHEDFSWYEIPHKNFLTAYYHGGSPYLVGYLGSVKINIDPELLYDNMRLYDTKGKIIYDFDKFKLLELI